MKRTHFADVVENAIADTGTRAGDVFFMESGLMSLENLSGTCASALWRAARICNFSNAN